MGTASTENPYLRTIPFNEGRKNPTLSLPYCFPPTNLTFRHVCAKRFF
jgi:hypothetical protein